MNAHNNYKCAKVECVNKRLNDNECVSQNDKRDRITS